jgi:hypothetical protein
VAGEFAGARVLRPPGQPQQKVLICAEPDGSSTALVWGATAALGDGVLAQVRTLIREELQAILEPFLTEREALTRAIDEQP